jgi:hypothetical protein
LCIEWVVDIAVPFHKPVVLLAREPGRNKREKPEGEEPRGKGKGVDRRQVRKRKDRKSASLESRRKAETEIQRAQHGSQGL